MEKKKGKEQIQGKGKTTKYREKNNRKDHTRQMTAAGRKANHVLAGKGGVGSSSRRGMSEKIPQRMVNGKAGPKEIGGTLKKTGGKV